MTKISLVVPVGAAATVANALAGTDIEFPSGASALTILGNADIVGMTHSFRFTVPSNGGPVPMNPIPTSRLNLASTVGTVKADEDLIVSRLPIPAGSRLVHTITNPGAASNARFDYILE